MYSPGAGAQPVLITGGTLAATGGVSPTAALAVAAVVLFVGVLLRIRTHRLHRTTP
ncbi:hypothetical protein [Microbacterium sp. RURRCA19A]|uniref:hypothetical protein n=1 Tax=Microbacterium sp. RURRCA19A TaxID=1907391 RepID=UPI000955268F|nr:hypothetical protein [Microbacterium sp. RURRCA19A]SIR93870.1 hypothetical protein SAMN05880568_1917 [Microbacterium sp. RURRCA19A]